MELKNAIRCTAQHNGSECKSAIFYDWGLKLAKQFSYKTVTGEDGRFSGSVDTMNVQICVRCNTPYVDVDGALIDISDELSQEDVKAIIARGQVNLPHPAVKDP